MAHPSTTPEHPSPGLAPSCTLALTTASSCLDNGSNIFSMYIISSFMDALHISGHGPVLRILTKQCIGHFHGEDSVTGTPLSITGHAAKQGERHALVLIVPSSATSIRPRHGKVVCYNRCRRFKTTNSCSPMVRLALSGDKSPKRSLQH